MKRAFMFTPSISLFVECEKEAQFDTAFGQLSPGGSVLMPSNNYGSSRKFSWLSAPPGWRGDVICNDPTVAEPER